MNTTHNTTTNYRVIVTAPTRYQQGSMRHFGITSKQLGNGSFYAEQKFENEDEAKQYLKDRAEMYYDGNGDNDAENLAEALDSIERCGRLDLDAASARIEPTEEWQETEQQHSTIDSNRVTVDFTDKLYDMIHSALCNAVSMDYFYDMQVDIDNSIYSEAKKKIKKDDKICREDVWMEVIKMGEKLVFDGHYDDTAYLDAAKIKDNFKHVPDYIIGSYLTENDYAETGAMLLQYLIFGEAIYG